MCRRRLFILLAVALFFAGAQAQKGDPGRFLRSRPLAHWLQGLKAPGKTGYGLRQEKPAPLLLYQRQSTAPDPLQRLLNWDCRVMLRLNQNLYFVVRYS